MNRVPLEQLRTGVPGNSQTSGRLVPAASTTSRDRSLPVVDNCGGCGVCCLHMGYPAFAADNAADAEYWQRMPDALRDELIEYISTYVDPGDGELDGPCCWLDLETRRCKHHPFRPRVCRDFAIGGSGCRQWRNHYHRLIDAPGGE